MTSSVYDGQQGIIPLAEPAAVAFGFINRDPSEFGFASSATSRWDFKFDVLDLKVGTSICILECLSLDPYIGVKWASIKQTQNIGYTGFSVGGAAVNVQNRKTNNFYGVGPSFGFDSAWQFYPHWSLSSGLSGALLCGKLNLNEQPGVNAADNSIGINLNSSRKSRIRPAVKANIGVDWNTCFCSGVELVVGVAYEAQ